MQIVKNADGTDRAIIETRDYGKLYVEGVYNEKDYIVALSTQGLYIILSADEARNLRWFLRDLEEDKAAMKEFHEATKEKH